MAYFSCMYFPVNSMSYELLKDRQAVNKHRSCGLSLPMLKTAKTIESNSKSNYFQGTSQNFTSKNSLVVMRVVNITTDCFCRWHWENIISNGLPYCWSFVALLHLSVIPLDGCWGCDFVPDVCNRFQEKKSSKIFYLSFSDSLG